VPNFRIPGEEDVAGPGSLRPTGGISAPDFSGLDRGVQNLAAGFGAAADSAGRVGDVLQRRKNASEIAAAEAVWTKGVIGISNEYGTSNDFDGMPKKTDASSLKLKEQAAALITDEDAKAEWLNQTELRRISLVGGSQTRAEQLRQENERVKFGEALATSAEIIADPTIDEGTRTLAREQLLGTIQMGREVGLLLPAEVDKFKREHLEVAEQNLAIGRAQLGILTDPQSVMDSLAIPIGGQAGPLVESARLAQGGKTLTITPELARMVAPLIGDGALPQDDKLAKAYLEDPEVNARYGAAVVEQLTNRFNGDVTAAVIAAAPNGSLELAEKWVKSNHNEAVLPEPVRQYYRKVMGGLTAGTSGTRIPVIGSNNVDLAKLDVGVLDRFEDVQSAIGVPLPIIGADAAGSGITVNIKRLKPEERIALIQTASAMGFTGIGVGDDTLILSNDGERAVLGAKPPAWAKDVLEQHAAGSIGAAVPPVRSVAPEYAALTFDQRLKLHAQAKAALDSHAVDLKSSIAIAEENAPVALATTGQYTGVMPTVDDYVAAYGAAKGIEGWKSFDAAVDTAEATFGMRTMTATEIAKLVESAKPTQGGDMAAVEQKRFETLAAAAEATLEARKKDPAGYVIEVFPGVAKAWEAVSENPKDSNALAAAFTATATAQESLGLDLELMPKAQADAIASTFNNADLGEDDRIGAVTSTLFATKDEAYQAAIFDQLVKSGLPRTTSGALGALERGDQGAATRLFRASLLDPDKLPGKIGETDANIAQRMQEKLFDEGQVGNVLYGISGGRAENYQRYMDDGTLLTSAVKMRLVDGSAANLDQAIDLAAKDLYGDVRVYSGKPYSGGAGALMVLPADESPEPLRLGFNALLGQVGDALMANLTPLIANAPTSKSEAAIAVQARDGRIADILEEGYFAPSGPNTFVFVDPATGQAIASPAGGGDMEFTRDQVIEAGVVAKEANRNRYQEWFPVNPNATPERMQSIYGSNFGKPAARDPFN
jgi:hypothetical protein